MKSRVQFAVLASALAAVTVLPEDARGYVTNGVSWNLTQVPYLINTTNLDLPGSAVESAVRAGADTWRLQAGVNLRFLFSGLSSTTTFTFDNINLVMFRNASSGSAIATTYWWSSGPRIIETDIVFWDGAFQFFSGTSGCSNGFYIEDIGAHEFGHALGLGHSNLTSATMYFSTGYCNAGSRLLDADDIAGVRSLYPTLPVPTAPTGFRIVN
jgi:hypothetical protein